MYGPCVLTVITLLKKMAFTQFPSLLHAVIMAAVRNFALLVTLLLAQATSAMALSLAIGGVHTLSAAGDEGQEGEALGRKVEFRNQQAVAAAAHRLTLEIGGVHTMPSSTPSAGASPVWDNERQGDHDAGGGRQLDARTKKATAAAAHHLTLEIGGVHTMPVRTSSARPSTVSSNEREGGDDAGGGQGEGREAGGRQVDRRQQKEDTDVMKMTLSNGGIHTMPRFIKPPLIIVTMPLNMGLPVTVTAQRQLVTSYVPLYTVCPQGSSPEAEPLESSLSSGASNDRDATSSTSTRHNANAMVKPDRRDRKVTEREVYDNSSASAAACSTSYRQTVTPICATTLFPLAAPNIPVTKCQQSITFSSEYGYARVPASKGAGGSDGGEVAMRLGESDAGKKSLKPL